MSEPAGWYRFDGHGHRVDALLTDRVAAELADRGAPWMVAGAVSGPAAGVPRVLSGATVEPPGGYEPFEEVELSGGVRELLVSAADRTIWVPPAELRWHVLQVLRAVRNLLRWQALADRSPCLHGALVARDGRGVVLLGGKRAGKTSTMLAALSAGFDFVSNDDVTLVLRDSGWQGVGWPRSINVRMDAAAALSRRDPRIGRLQDASTHPRMERLTDRSTTFSIFPSDVCELLGARMLASAGVAALVMLRFGDVSSGGETLLDPEAAEQRLPQFVDRIATDHDDYLESWFPGPDETAVAALAKQLATDLPVYSLVHDLDHVDRTVSILQNLVGSDRRGPGRC